MVAIAQRTTHVCGLPAGEGQLGGDDYLVKPCNPLELKDPADLAFALLMAVALPLYLSAGSGSAARSSAGTWWWCCCTGSGTPPRGSRCG